MLDAAGFEDAVIAASNDLDEMLINDLKIQGAAITSWGVGTHLITSKDCPSFGGVYNWLPLKRRQIPSEDQDFREYGKITNPGTNHYRVYDKETGKLRADLICFADETYDTSEELLLFDPTKPGKDSSSGRKLHDA